MTRTERRRLAAVVLLSLLPWPAVWLGLYKLDSLLWTFALYHGVCLLPAAWWGRRLWRDAVRRPTPGEWGALALAVAVVVPLALWAYGDVGARLLDADGVRVVVTERGFQARWLLGLAVYFIPVNAVLEELFWRGVILNELRGTSETPRALGHLWALLTFGAWHYLVVRLLLRPGWAELATLGIMLSGVFLAWLYRRTRSIVVPILWHAMVFDLALIVIFAAIVRAA